MRPYDLGRLRLLYELSHRGTLTAVAQALSYSPSAVSQQLSALEAEVGVRLLEPDGRRVRLTEQAHILVAHTDVVLRELERADAEIAASLEAVTGTFRLAALQTAILALTLDALNRARLDYPGLAINVTEAEPEEALSALHARQYDAVILENYPGYPPRRLEDTEQRVLCTEPMRLATPTGQRVDLADLKNSAWILEPPGSPAREWALGICRDAGFEPRVAFESPDVAVQVRFVESGLGAAFLPDLVWFDRVPTVSLSRLDGEPTRQLVFITRRGSRASPAMQAVFDLLKEGEARARFRVGRHLDRAAATS